MRKHIMLTVLSITIVLLMTACGTGNDDGGIDNDANDELATLEVDFPLPGTADVGEEVTLEANVTYGDEMVDDADEVEFEYWEKGDKDNSTMVEAENAGDGSYTATVTFDEDAVYEVYAHTTAREMHTMPKKAIQVGDAELDETEDEAGDEHIDGFAMEFQEPEDVSVDDDTDLTVDVELEDSPLEDANVRFEIWNDDVEEHEWLDTNEPENGKYTASYAFPEEGTYSIQIHVEDNNDLHEHETVEIDVSE